MFIQVSGKVNPSFSNAIGMQQLHEALQSIRRTSLGARKCNEMSTGPADPDAVDVHAVVLFLLAQVYVRRHHQAAQQPAMDVWPGGPSLEAALGDATSPSRPQRTIHTGTKAVYTTAPTRHAHPSTCFASNVPPAFCPVVSDWQRHGVSASVVCYCSAVRQYQAPRGSMCDKHVVCCACLSVSLHDLLTN